jgi:hypothetical protein
MLKQEKTDGYIIEHFYKIALETYFNNKPQLDLFFKGFDNYKEFHTPDKYYPLTTAKMYEYGTSQKLSLVRKIDEIICKNDASV